MTSLEMLSSLASRLGDPAFQRFWPQELKHWINLGQQDVSWRLDAITPDWSLVVTPLAVTSGTQDYDLPTGARMIRIVRVRQNAFGASATGYRMARHIEVEEFERMVASSDWTPTANDPAWLHYGLDFHLEPNPSTNVSDGILLYHTSRPSDLSVWDDTETSTLRPEYHDLVVRYAEVIAKRSKGEETGQLWADYQGSFINIEAAWKNMVVAA